MRLKFDYYFDLQPRKLLRVMRIFELSDFELSGFSPIENLRVNLIAYNFTSSYAYIRVIRLRGNRLLPVHIYENMANM